MLLKVIRVLHSKLRSAPESDVTLRFVKMVRSLKTSTDLFSRIWQIFDKLSKSILGEPFRVRLVYSTQSLIAPKDISKESRLKTHSRIELTRKVAF